MSETGLRSRRAMTWPAAVLLVAGLLLTTTGARAAGPIGLWLTQGGKSHVEIADCGGKLCGTIVWLKEPLDDSGKEKVDKNNPDDGLKSRKLIGLPMLKNFVKASEENEWDSGTIYNPEDGKTYKSTMTLKDDDTLKVRGYVGIPLFGKTQVWTRVK